MSDFPLPSPGEIGLNQEGAKIKPVTVTQSGLEQTAAGVIPGIREDARNKDLRDKNPDLWNNIREDEVAKDRMAYRLAERVKTAELSPREVMELLRGKAPSCNYVNLTNEDIRPELNQISGSVGVLPGRRASTIRFGLDNAVKIIEVDTFMHTPDRTVYEIPYPSFAKPVTPSEKLDGAEITNLAIIRITEEQATAIREALKDVPATV